MSTICQWEIEGPHILDEACFESFVARHSAHLEGGLRRLYLVPAVRSANRLRLPRMDDKMILYVGDRAKVDIENFKMLIRNLDPDLTAVLRAIAHLEVSYKRICQVFRLLVWNELCLKFAAELRKHLDANLGLTGPDSESEVRDTVSSNGGCNGKERARGNENHSAHCSRSKFGAA